MPDERLLPKATALLAKAGSTESIEERHALVLRCYGVLARFLNQVEEENPAVGRRQERRQLRDRRRAPRSQTQGESQPSTGAKSVKSDAAAAYRAAQGVDPPAHHVTISV